MARFKNRIAFVNKHPIYEKKLEKRNIKKGIYQFDTPYFTYPSTEEINEMVLIPHTWKIGSRYWKLADEFYGDSTYWWVIALFNKAPTEAHLSYGELVFVPTPLDAILSFVT